MWLETVEFGHGFAGKSDAADAVGVARGFGEEENGDAEEDGPERAEAVRDSPLGRVVVGFFGAPVDLGIISVNSRYAKWEDVPYTQSRYPM